MEVATNSPSLNQNNIDHQKLKDAANNSSQGTEIAGRAGIIESKNNSLTEEATSAAAIYHADDNVIPSGTSTKVDLYTYTSDFQSGGIEYKSEQLRNISKVLHHIKVGVVPLYEDFKKQLVDVYPQFTDKDFGMTVQSDGTLTLVNGKSWLDDEEKETINTFMNNFNGSDKLSKLALEFAKESVKYVETERGADGGSMWEGKYDLTMDNFNEAFDFSLMVLGGPPAVVELSDQLSLSNIEAKYTSRQYQKLVDGEWIEIPYGTQPGEEEF